MREGEWWNWKDAMVAALIDGEHIVDCSASGACDDAVAHAMCDPAIVTLCEQVESPNDAWLKGELRETGAEWDLSDHDTNCERMIWIIACDWKENGAE